MSIKLFCNLRKQMIFICNSPITNQVCSRNKSKSSFTCTHFFGLRTVSLVRVVPTVVLIVALQSSIYTSSFEGNKASWWSCTCFLEQAFKNCTYLLDYKINRPCIIKSNMMCCCEDIYHCHRWTSLYSWQAQSYIPWRDDRVFPL